MVKILGERPLWIWALIFFFLLLAVLPDPTDVVDVGLPILEPLLAYAVYYYSEKKQK